MADIKKYLDSIKTAIFGKDVRKSIHDGIEAINNDCTNRLNKQDSELSQSIKKQNEIIQANRLKQDELERKYDEQIKNIASSEPQNAEIVDARAGFPTLGSIIKQKIYHFKNISEMKNCLTLVPGDVVETLGYYQSNDGGGAKYLIRAKADNDVEDNGSIHFVANLVAALITEKVNVKQFGAKSIEINSLSEISVELDNKEDNSSYFTKALHYVYNLAQKSKTRGYDCNLYVPAGNYVLKNSIEISPLIHLIADGLVSFYWVNTSESQKYCFKILTKETDFNYVLGGLSQRFRSPVINGLNGSFSLYNAKKDKSDIAFLIGGINDNSEAETTIIDTIEIEGFNTAIELYCKNLYLNRFKNIRVQNCEKAIITSGELQNSGENILWEKCLFCGCNTVIKFEDIALSMKFIDTSFDGNGVILYQYTPFYCELLFDRCWVEACGYDMAKKTSLTFNNVKALIYIENYEEQVRDYIKTTLILKDTYYIDSSSKNENCKLDYLFYGNTLKLIIDNFMYKTWLDYANTTPDYLCDDSVTDIINKNYVRSCYGIAPFISKHENLIQYPNFEEESTGYKSHVGGTLLSKDFKIENSTNITYLGIKAENDTNVLQITRDDTTQEARLVLKSVFKINPNNSQDVVTRLKIRTDSQELQDCKYNAKFNYYDSYDNAVDSPNWLEISDFVKENNYYIPKKLITIDTKKFDKNNCIKAELQLTIIIPNEASTKNIYVKELELYDSSNRANLL